VLATAHHAAGKVELTPPLASLWAGPMGNDATLAIYMPGRRFDLLASELISVGIDAHTPCIAVSKATTPDERVTRTTLAGWAQSVRMQLDRHRCCC